MIGPIDRGGSVRHGRDRRGNYPSLILCRLPGQGLRHPGMLIEEIERAEVLAGEHLSGLLVRCRLGEQRAQHVQGEAGQFGRRAFPPDLVGGPGQQRAFRAAPQEAAR